MIDISKFSSKPFIPWIILGIAALVFLITIIIFIKRGIIKDIFGLLYIGGLVCAFIFGLPLLKNLIGGLGFIPETLLKLSKDQIVSIISVILIILVWFILVKILNACFKKLFKYEKKISRFFGFLLGLPVALILTFASFQCLTTPYILKGSEQAKHSQPIVETICEKVINPIENILVSAGCPGDFEDIIILKVPEIDYDGYVEYKKSFDNIEKFKLNADSYFAELGTLDNSVITDSVADLNNVLFACTNFNKKIGSKLTSDVELYLDKLSGNQYSIGEQRTRLIENLRSVEASEELLAKVETVFVG